MKKFSKVLIICIGLTAASGSFAQAIALDHEGVPGVWMPFEMAKMALADGEELRLTKPLVKDLELQVSIKEERIVTLKSALSSCEDSKKISTGALDSAIKLQKEAEGELKKWYRKPGWWVFISAAGVLLLEGIGFGVARSLK